jgi:hypothetical protein
LDWTKEFGWGLRLGQQTGLATGEAMALRSEAGSAQQWATWWEVSTEQSSQTVVKTEAAMGAATDESLRMLGMATPWESDWVAAREEPLAIETATLSEAASVPALAVVSGTAS